tara:strand:- start:75 stop:782 length:708 start_codon:yes stop_codon:yes gene_type:complete
MRSDLYTISFTAIVTIILGLVLSVVTDSLRERQAVNEKLDIKKNILAALGFKNDSKNKLSNEETESLYNKHIQEFLVDSSGLPRLKTDNYEEKSTDLVLYKRIDNELTSGYAIPISGKGLWGTMYGYFAIESDGITVKGITFYKHKETPGLGAEVEKPWFQNNFIGKRLTDDLGHLVSIEVVKGFVSSDDPESYKKVDGISGATITCKGVTKFLKESLIKYEPYFITVRKDYGSI